MCRWLEEHEWPATFSLERVTMGRSFESVRMGVKEVSDRWIRASRALKKEDQIYRQKRAEMAKVHSS